MVENGRFDPMVLESLLHYPHTVEKTPLVVRAEADVGEEDPCMESTVAGAKGSSSMDLKQSPEHGDCTGTQISEEHGLGTLTQPIGNGRTIPQQQQEEERPGLNLPTKKRENWTAEKTDLLLEAVIAERMKSRSRLDNEPLWEGVAKRVPGRTGKECRMRMETLKKSYIAVKEYCDKERKQFAELKRAEFRKMKLATRIIDRWYYRIRDHCPPRPTKKSREESPGSSDVATRRVRPRGRGSSAASRVVVVETTWSSDCGVDVSLVWIIQPRTMGNGSVGKRRRRNGSVGKRRPSEFGTQTNSLGELSLAHHFLHEVAPRMLRDEMVIHHPTGPTEHGLSSTAPFDPFCSFDSFWSPDPAPISLLNDDFAPFPYPKILFDQDSP